MSLCVIAAGATLRLAVAAFTLGWTHSIERTGWEEDWRVSPQGLHIVEARVKGSGAGMEPGEGARLADGWWSWRPQIGFTTRLSLAASPAAPEGWRLCAEERCIPIGARDAGPFAEGATLAVCDEN